jgi:phosphate:Na+ symporter
MLESSPATGAHGDGPGLMSALGALLGGIGLFLLGMWLMTDGLKRAAGGALRRILVSFTQTTARGVLAGTGLTAVVQSSSAVTVATVGFVNAGLLTLTQALGVIYGSNVGTTMTGWIVAFTGIQVRLDAYALPLVGLGMLLRLTGPATRRGAYGQALAGFALFLLGIQALKTQFSELAGHVDFSALPHEGWRAGVLYFGIGVVLTILIQSSSATSAIAISATSAGIVPVPLAALVMVGADIGTSSTAAFAAAGATANARRAAASHVLFNLVTAAFAVLALGGLLWLSRLLQSLLGLPDNEAVTLAVFSTTFNIIGVLLVLPFTGRMARFLERRFVTQDESLARPQHLDDSLLAVPALALRGMLLEARRLGTLSLRLAADSCQRTLQDLPALQRRNDVLDQLGDRIRAFVARLDFSAFPADAAAQVAPLLRGLQHFGEVSDLAAAGAVPESPLDHALRGAQLELVALTRQALHAADTAAADFTPEHVAAAAAAAEAHYESLKADLLAAAAAGRLPVSDLDPHMQEAGRLHRMVERAVKGTQRLQRAGSTDPLAQPVAGGGPSG